MYYVVQICEVDIHFRLITQTEKYQVTQRMLWLI